MRALRRLARPAVATAAAVLVLSGCGGDDDSDSSTASSSSSSSSSSSAGSSSAGTSSSGSADPAVAAFCEQAQTFQQTVSGLQAATPDEIPGLLEESVTAFDAAEPPAEIAGDWQVVGDALRQFSTTTSSLDLNTQEGATAFEQAGNDFISAASGPEGTNITSYVEENCTL